MALGQTKANRNTINILYFRPSYFFFECAIILNMENQLLMPALNHLRLYLSTLKAELKKKKFDYMIVPANSGIFMAFCAYRHYKDLLEQTNLVVIPIFTSYKFKSSPLHYDHDLLLPAMTRIFSRLGQPQTILFVDDQISGGQAFQTCFNLSVKALPETMHAEWTIIAEGDGYHWEYPQPNTDINFIPYAIRQDLNTDSVIFEFISDATVEQVSAALGEQLDKKQTANLLLGQSVKSLRDRSPVLSFISQEAEDQIQDYYSKRKKIISLIDRVAEKAGSTLSSQPFSDFFDNPFGSKQLLHT
jgi:hypothetical protein